MPGPIQQHKSELRDLCRTHGVERLEVFGSAMSDAFDRGSSDLDFIVRFADTSPGYADRYMDFAEALEDLFKRPVDLISKKVGPKPSSFRRAAFSIALRERGACVETAFPQALRSWQIA